MKKANFVLVFALLAVSNWAFASETVTWSGIVKEEDGYHTVGHRFGHSLEFVKQDDGAKYDIVDSDELESLHIQKEKNLLVEITAEKTNRFLFWGGNLIVKNFKVLQELDDIPHREPVRTVSDGGARSRR